MLYIMYVCVYVLYIYMYVCVHIYLNHPAVLPSDSSCGNLFYLNMLLPDDEPLGETAVVV